MPNLRGWEIFILLAIVLLLFGSKKLPDAARGVGRSLRIFKAETKGLMDDDESTAVTNATQTPPAVENPPNAQSAPGTNPPGTTATTPSAGGEADRSAPASGPSHT